MHSWLVKGSLSAEEKEKAATKLFELDVNKSATKKAKTGSALSPFLYIWAPMGKNRHGEYGKRKGPGFPYVRGARITQMGGGVVGWVGGGVIA
jgi:hypothetical protein